MTREAEAPTRWYHLVAYFFGGASLTNAVPHFVAGVSGRALQTPFASPPTEGLSSATVNVLWALFNLLVAYLLLVRSGRFELRRSAHAIVFALGVTLMALELARALGRLHGGAL
ncbi:MAG: hypothetical protein KC420_19930 [Myxococcales bacterium]|nr:hypothetical protein [Myxococcales bacterium]MCB9701795.1 hypothetical protein [Myxococcales bacterium]